MYNALTIFMKKIQNR